MVAYHQPTELCDALAVRAETPAWPLAGGTDIYPAMAQAAAWGRAEEATFLDLSQIAELRGISRRGDAFHFGATTSWTEIAEAPLPPAFDGLKAAARAVGGRQIQNRGCLGGNLCNASPAADGVPPLLTLNAEVELARAGGERRRLALRDFILGNRKTALGDDELLVAIIAPAPPEGARGGFLKLGARAYLVISIVMVAGVIGFDEAGAVAEARLSVGACSSVAERLPGLEAALIGRPAAALADAVAHEHFAGLAPIDDVRADAAYRLQAAEVLTRRLLREFTP